MFHIFLLALLASAGFALLAFTSWSEGARVSMKICAIGSICSLIAAFVAGVKEKTNPVSTESSYLSHSLCEKILADNGFGSKPNE